MYFPNLRKMLFESENEVLIFDPETIRIWKGDPITGKILTLLEEGKSIPKIAQALTQSENSISEEIEDLYNQGILTEKKEIGKKGSTLFSVDVLPHGIFEFPLPLETLKKGTAYLAHLSKQEGENEAVITVKIDSDFDPDQMSAVRDILDEVSSTLHMDLLFSLFITPQYVEQVLDIRIDHMTIKGHHNTLSILESLNLDTDIVSVRIEDESLQSTKNAVSELKSTGIKNFELPFTYMDVHLEFLNMLSFETFSEIPLSDKLTNIMVNILSRTPVVNPHCSAGTTTFFCNSKGKIYPCDLAQQVCMGTLDENHKDLKIPPNVGGYSLKDCLTCWTRNLCGGGCFLQPRCSEFQQLTEQVIYSYPDIINQMKEKIATSSSTSRLEIIVDVLERIRQNYLFSWCKLQ